MESYNGKRVVGGQDEDASGTQSASARRMTLSPAAVLAALQLPGSGGRIASQRRTAVTLLPPVEDDAEVKMTRTSTGEFALKSEFAAARTRRQSMFGGGVRPSGGDGDASTAVGLSSDSVFVLRTMMNASANADEEDSSEESSEEDEDEEESDEDDDDASPDHRNRNRGSQRGSLLRQGTTLSTCGSVSGHHAAGKRHSFAGEASPKGGCSLTALVSAQDAQAAESSAKGKKGESGTSDGVADAAYQAVRNARNIQQLIQEAGDEQTKCHEKCLRRRDGQRSKEHRGSAMLGGTTDRSEVEAKKASQKCRRKRRLGISFRLKCDHGIFSQPAGWETQASGDALAAGSKKEHRRQTLSERLRRGSLESRGHSQEQTRISAPSRKSDIGSLLGERRSNAEGRVLPMPSQPLSFSLFSLAEAATPVATPKQSVDNTAGELTLPSLLQEPPEQLVQTTEGDGAEHLEKISEDDSDDDADVGSPPSPRSHISFAVDSDSESSKSSSGSEASRDDSCTATLSPVGIVTRPPPIDTSLPDTPKQVRGKSQAKKERDSVSFFPLDVGTPVSDCQSSQRESEVPTPFKRRRLPEIPRLRNKYRDRRFILSDNWRKEAETIKRNHLEIASQLGLEEKDWSWMGDSIYSVSIADLAHAAERKEDNLRHSSATKLQRKWRSLRMLRTTVKLRLERRRCIEKIQCWWHNQSAYQLPVKTRVALRPIHKRAAQIIEAVARGWLTRRRLRLKMELHKVSWQMECLRVELGGNETMAIFSIQASARGFLARRRVIALREEQRCARETNERHLGNRKNRGMSFMMPPQAEGKRASRLCATIAATTEACKQQLASFFGTETAPVERVEPVSPPDNDVEQDDEGAEDETEKETHYSVPQRHTFTPLGPRLKRPLDPCMVRMGGLRKWRAATADLAEVDALTNLSASGGIKAGSFALSALSSKALEDQEQCAGWAMADRKPFRKLAKKPAQRMATPQRTRKR